MLTLSGKYCSNTAQMTGNRLAHRSGPRRDTADERSTPRRDKVAGDFLRELRKARGLSPEEMPRVMRKETGLAPRWIPSSRTIRRIEDEGVIPQVRFKFSLAQFHDLDQDEIWRRPERAK
jgi:hypothetical protein